MAVALAHHDLLQHPHSDIQSATSGVITGVAQITPDGAGTQAYYGDCSSDRPPYIYHGVRDHPSLGP